MPNNSFLTTVTLNNPMHLILSYKNHSKGLLWGTSHLVSALINLHLPLQFENVCHHPHWIKFLNQIGPQNLIWCFNEKLFYILCIIYKAMSRILSLIKILLPHIKFYFSERRVWWDSDMAQWVKVLATKPDNPRHTWSHFPLTSTCAPWHVRVHMNVCMNTCMHVHIYRHTQGHWHTHIFIET